MSDQNSFDFDHHRHTTALALSPAHQSEFQRLVKTLCHGPKSQFLILEFNDVDYRAELVRRINELVLTEQQTVTQLRISSTDLADFAAVEAALITAARDHDAVHILGGESWFDRPRLEVFNIRREVVARAAPARLLWWLTTDAVEHVAQWAPDLWSWRAGVYDFTQVVATMIPGIDTHGPGAVDGRSLAERAKRITEIKAFLFGNAAIEDAIRLPLLDELAELNASIGQLDEALRIRQEEQLPVYERLGDVRERAITLAKIGFQLISAGHRQEAQDVLSRALRDTQRMAIPEAEVIAEFMQRHNLASE